MTTYTKHGWTMIQRLCALIVKITTCNLPLKGMVSKTRRRHKKAGNDFDKISIDSCDTTANWDAAKTTTSCDAAVLAIAQ